MWTEWDERSGELSSCGYWASNRRHLVKLYFSKSSVRKTLCKLFLSPPPSHLSVQLTEGVHLFVSLSSRSHRSLNLFLSLLLSAIISVSDHCNVPPPHSSLSFYWIPSSLDPSPCSSVVTSSPPSPPPIHWVIFRLLLIKMRTWWDLESHEDVCHISIVHNVNKLQLNTWIFQL